MLTKEALRESMDAAVEEMSRAPVDGMLAYIIKMAEARSDNWTADLAATVAIAYAKSVSKNGGRG